MVEGDVGGRDRGEDEIRTFWVRGHSMEGEGGKRGRKFIEMKGVFSVWLKGRWEEGTEGRMTLQTEMVAPPLLVLVLG